MLTDILLTGVTDELEKAEEHLNRDGDIDIHTRERWAQRAERRALISAVCAVAAAIQEHGDKVVEK